MAELIRQCRDAPGVDCAVRFAFDRIGGEECLEAAMVAADTHRTIGIYCDVPKMSGNAADSSQEFALRKHRASHARSEREQKDDFQSSRRAP
jgi:hypothetical protein